VTEKTVKKNEIHKRSETEAKERETKRRETKKPRRKDGDGNKERVKVRKKRRP